MQGAEVLTKFTADTTEVDKATDNTSKGFDKLQIAGVAAFTALTAAVDKFAIGLAKEGIEYNAQMESFMVRLTTLTGSAEEANDILTQIKKDALKTPFDVKSLTQANSLLLSTGLSAEDARKDIINLGNAVSATGGGNAELQRMAVNLQQIKNVGKASSLDIKQFAYAGIDIYGLLAKSMGITRKEASDLDVTYEMLSKALADANSEGGQYYGAMEAQSKTYNGAMSNLTESIDVLKGELAEGLFNALKDVIPKLTDLFNWIGKNKDIIIAIAIPLLTMFNTFMGFMALKGVITTFQLLWGVLMANPIGAVIAIIAGLVAGIIYLWNTSETFRDIVKAVWSGIKNAVSGAIAGVMSFLQNMINGIKGAINFLKNLKTMIVSAFTHATDSMKNLGTNMIKGLWNGLSGMKDWVIDKVKGMGKAILGGLKKVLGISSPSKEFAIVGKYSAEGYVEGLEDMQKQVDETIGATFNPFNNATIGSMTASTPSPNITVQNSMEMDALGQLVNNVKTFSGGAKNDYNYVGGY